MRDMTKLGTRWVGIALAVALVMVPTTSTAADSPSASKGKVLAKPGKYKGTLVEDGEPSAKEWLRFKVSANGRKVTSYKSRVWVVCYQYPNTYYQLPVVFEAPNARIGSDRRVDRSWTETFTVDGEEETLTGRLKLKFKRNGKVKGEVSVDFANCATRLGDPPYFVPLQAKHI